MNRHVRGNLSRELGNPDILHNHRIRLGVGNRLKGFDRLAQFVVKHQRVESEVAFHPAPVQGAHDIGQFSKREAHLCAGGEVLQTKVNGIRPRFDGGV